MKNNSISNPALQEAVNRSVWPAEKNRVPEVAIAVTFGQERGLFNCDGGSRESPVAVTGDAIVETGFNQQQKAR